MSTSGVQDPDPQTPGPPTPDPQTPAEIEVDIERQREQLAATVDALQAKLDVKTWARAKAAELKDRATTPEGKPRPDLLMGVAVAVVIAGGLTVWRARRHR